jgi:hypothetical protein
LAVGVVEREHIASWLDVNLWLRLRKTPYSSKAYSRCGVDECGERVDKDVEFGKNAGIWGKVSFFPEVSTKIFSAAYNTQFNSHQWRKSKNNVEHDTEEGKGSRSY